ncbi:MAG: Ig-like domain-containing protein [Gemmatimonadales bacterium]
MTRHPAPARHVSTAFKVVATLASIGAALVSILTFAKSEGIYRGSILPATDAGWVRLEPSADTATALGDTLRFAAAVTDTRGLLLQGADIVWSTPDSGIVRVRSDGTALAVGPGETSIIATVGHAVGKARVVVRQAVAAVQLPSVDGLSLAQGSSLPLIARTLDGRGHAIADRRPIWRVADTTVLSVDSTGRANGISPGTSRITATVDGLAAAASVTVTPVLGALALFAPSAERALPGTTLPDPVSIRTLTRQRRPMGGILVKFHAVDATGLAAGSIAPDTARSDADGVVRVYWTVGDRPGQQLLVAEAEPLDTALRVPIEVEPVAANTRLAATDDRPTGTIGLPLSRPLGIRVTDSAGRPLPGVPVRWTALQGAAVARSARTDSAGEARVDWTLGAKAGLQRLRATVGSGRLVPPIDLTGVATAGPPARLIAVGGGGQRGTVGSTLPSTLAVRVTDAAGNPVPEVSVRAVIAIGTASDSVVTTDSSGIARVRWTLGERPAVEELRLATASLSALFHATALPGAPATIAFENAPRSPSVSSPVKATARVRDRFGNALPRVAVHATVTLGHLASKVMTSDTAGRVTVTWSLGAGSGDQVLTLRGGGVTGTLTLKRMVTAKKRKK